MYFDQALSQARKGASMTRTTWPDAGAKVYRVERIEAGGPVGYYYYENSIGSSWIYWPSPADLAATDWEFVR